jgi:ubiquinone/menaquinone biosynthesis C-methylase UbiE
MMKDASYYGETLADIYDDLYPFIPPGAIEALAEMAGHSRKVLELGVGTGRFALPLAEKGLRITGVDASPAMLKVLEAKVGTLEMSFLEDDFAKLENVTDGPFSLAFCNFSSFFLLLEQEQQINSFQRISELLESGGRFAIEAFSPDVTRYGKDQPVFTGDFHDDTEVIFEAARHDSLSQRVSCRFVRMAHGQFRIIPVELRYCWPSEMDLMARLAGLELENRWASWEKEPFTAQSFRHISVFRKP